MYCDNFSHSIVLVFIQSSHDKETFPVALYLECKD